MRGVTRSQWRSSCRPQEHHTHKRDRPSGQHQAAHVAPSGWPVVDPVGEPARWQRGERVQEADDREIQPHLWDAQRKGRQYKVGLEQRIEALKERGTQGEREGGARQPDHRAARRVWGALSGQGARGARGGGGATVATAVATAAATAAAAHAAAATVELLGSRNVGQVQQDARHHAQWERACNEHRQHERATPGILADVVQVSTHRRSGRRPDTGCHLNHCESLSKVVAPAGYGYGGETTRLGQ